MALSCFRTRTFRRASDRNLHRLSDIVNIQAAAQNCHRTPVISDYL